MKIKTIFRAAVVVLFCLIFSATAYAVEEKQFSLNDLKMKISIDDSFAVITRDTAENDPAFEAAGLEYSSTMQTFRTAGIYLQAVSSDGGYILTVTMNQDSGSQSVVSYNRLSGEEMESLRAGFLLNSIYTDAKICEINESRYISLPFTQTQGDVTLYGMQYNTVENGMNINITLQTAVAPLGESTIWIIDDAVNSIEFTERAESVSSFNPANVIFWLVFAILILAAAAFILTGLIRKGKISLPVKGGFDDPERRLFGFLHKKRAEEPKPHETRQQIIDNIDHGGDYNVFTDIEPSPQSETEDRIPAIFNKIRKEKKK